MTYLNHYKSITFSFLEDDHFPKTVIGLMQFLQNEDYASKEAEIKEVLLESMFNETIDFEFGRSIHESLSRPDRAAENIYVFIRWWSYYFRNKDKFQDTLNYKKEVNDSSSN